MVDGLDGLRHDAVIGRHDDDRNVGDGGAAGAHGRKGFVARRVEERDLLAVQLDAVGADMLGDAAGLALDDVGLADIVQQRGLAVVHVAHDGHDRRTRHEVLLLVFVVVVDRLLNLHRDEFDLVAELLGHDHERFGVETLVDRHHQSQIHAGRDDLSRRDVHHRRQLAHGHEFGDFERRTFHFLAFELLVHTLGYGVALVLAVFCTLALGALGRQTGKGVLYLLRNLLVAHFGAYDRLGSRLALVLVAAAFARSGLVLARTSGTVLASLSALIAALTVAARRVAFRGLAHVHLLFLETFAFMLAAGDESRHVHRAEHLRTRQGHGFGAEDIVFRRCGFGLGCRCCSRSWCRSQSRCRSCGRSGGRRGSRFSGFGLRRSRRGRSRCCGSRRCRLDFGSCRFLCGGFGLRRGFRRFDGRTGGCGLGRTGLFGRFHRFRLRGGSGGRSRLGFGRQVDLAEDLRLLDFILDADYVAFDDHLFFLLALLLFSFFESDGRLLQGDALTDRIACVACGAVRPELLLQNGISLRIDQRVGRSVALDTLLLQEVRDGIQSHLELLCNLNEP